MKNLQTLSNEVREWFAEREITHAVVGFSGGIDSTVTALLLNHAGIEVCLVVANSPNQRYSSPLGGKYLQKPSRNGFIEEFDTQIINYQWPFSLLTDDDAVVANEAAGPIIRNAIFYGVAAKLRSRGHKAIVVGTVNFSEAAFLGFWGLVSDGACNFYPISHLTKREVYDLARELDAPQEIIDATPSGDLFFEDTNDLKMIGATYDQIQEIIDCAESIPNWDCNGTYSRGDLVIYENKIYEYTWRTQLTFGNDNLAMNPSCSGFWKTIEISSRLKHLIESVENPEVLKDNIVRNAFKYSLSFPNFHLNDRLERFRNFSYNFILSAASGI
jgi:NAD+ synthase